MDIKIVYHVEEFRQKRKKAPKKANIKRLMILLVIPFLYKKWT